MTLKEKIQEYVEGLVKEKIVSDPADIQNAELDFTNGAEFVIKTIYDAINPSEVKTSAEFVEVVFNTLEELERE